MTRLALFLFSSLALLQPAPVQAAPVENAAFLGAGLVPPQYRKQPGDVSYQTMWRMQKRASGMLPRGARVITPVLRLAIGGVPERDRNEFKPASWGVAIVGRTIEEVLPMRRGGYFAVPAMTQAQARSEDAIVRFNTEQRKKGFEIGWQLAVPAGGKMPYHDLSRAFDELKMAQQDMAWWDIMAIDEKNARFDAVRACFTREGGRILVGGDGAGTALSPHCLLLPFDPARAPGNPEIAFVGELDSVTLDRQGNYAE